MKQIELIHVTCGLIQLLTTQLNDVTMELKQLKNANNLSASLPALIADHEAQLMIIAQELNGVAQRLGNYMDGRDIVDEDTNKLVNAAYKIINRR